MAVESVLRSAVSLKLNTGTRPGTCSMIVRTLSLGKVVPDCDAEKVMNTIGALIPVLKHPLLRVERTEVTQIES